MKIKVEKEKIVNAVRKLEAIELVLENERDAKEAIELILQQPQFLGEGAVKMKDVKVTAIQEYSDSAVAYKLMFLLEFVFEDTVPLAEQVALIKRFQDFFGKS
ncbi:MAG: hypothetical protein JXO48_09310 [Deltaproteobacteria bacterium]|nr:hypothetical protein [Deltaproteobacteria bacterium]